VAVVQAAVVLVGSCPGGSCPGGSCSGGSCPGGSCPGGSCSGGSCSGGSCADTAPGQRQELFHLLRIRNLGLQKQSVTLLCVCHETDNSWNNFGTTTRILTCK